MSAADFLLIPSAWAGASPALSRTADRDRVGFGNGHAERQIEDELPLPEAWGRAVPVPGAGVLNSEPDGAILP